MQDTATIETSGMSSRWRAISLIIIAALEAWLIWWAATRFIPKPDSWHQMMFLLMTATLVATGFDIANKGMPTRLAFCFWLCLVGSSTVHDIGRIWNRSTSADPMLTLVNDAIQVAACIIWIWRNPFLTTKTNPVIIKKEFT